MASEDQTIRPKSEGESNTVISATEGLPSSPIVKDQINRKDSVQSPTATVDAATTPDRPPNPRLQALATKKANLEATLASLQTQKAALVATATLPSGLAMPKSWSEEEKTKSALATANSAIKDHIALLHKYNEIKDIAQGLMGLIAESRGVRNKVVTEEYGLSEAD